MSEEKHVALVASRIESAPTEQTDATTRRVYIVELEDATTLLLTTYKPKESSQYLMMTEERCCKFLNFVNDDTSASANDIAFHNLMILYYRWITEEMNGNEGDDVHYVPPAQNNNEQVPTLQMVPIPKHLYDRLVHLGIFGADDVRGHNVGKSDYSKHLIQPWSIWRDYDLDPWSADIVKRILRHKEGESRITDLEKIKHICDELIRQEKYVKQE